MSYSRIITAFALALFAYVGAHGTEVASTATLNIYYPNYSSVDMAFGKMPDTSNRTVDFCCEAAFTGQLLSTFSHTNIADDHVGGGKVYKGYTCRANTGAFAWGGGKSYFMRKKDYHPQSQHYNMAFCQYLIILNGQRQPMWERMRRNRTRYRALCEIGGRLCFCEAKKVMTLEAFVESLVEAKVTNAIYLDMGAGWNYAWYRDNKDKVVELFPESKQAKDFRYRTNWVVFYK